MRYPNQYWTLEDLDVYQLAGKAALHSGPLYSEEFRANHLPFLYTPFAALLCALVAGVTFSVLKALVTAASVASLLAATWLAFRLAGTAGRARQAAGTLLITGLAMWLDPVSQTLTFGQVNLFLMLLVLADLSQGDDRWWKGTGTGIAAGIKLTPLIFVGYLLITRRFRAAGMAVATLAATMAIGFAALPGQSTQYWIDGKFNSSGQLGSGYGGNQSLYGMILRLMHNGPHAHTVWLAAAVLVGAGGLLLSAWAHHRGDELLAICTCAITGLLVSPVSWDHHWVWVVPAAVWAAARLPRDLPPHWRFRRSGPPLAWLAAAAILAVFIDIPHTPGPAGPSTHLNGLIWLMPVLGNAGYHWSGTQIIVGNLYAVFGLAFLIAMPVYLAATGRSVPGGHRVSG